MSITNYPNGVSSFGMPILGGGRFMTTGNVFFVDSGNTAKGGDNPAKGTSPDTPFLTIDFAIGRCTANNGDVIFVMPGHTENVTAAAGIDFDVAGISCIGLGSGAVRPTITLDTATTADIDIAAANILLENLVFVGDIDALAAPIDVDAADFTMINCEMRDSGTKNTVRWILGDAGADRMKIINCINRGTDTAGNTAWITLNGSDEPIIKDCKSNGNFSAANIEVITAAITDGLITGNHLENANASDVNIEGLSASTGWISHNMCRNATDTQVTWINTPGNMSLFENYGVNNNGETGILAGTPSA
jgi:hypothetical protein